MQRELTFLKPGTRSQQRLRAESAGSESTGTNSLCPFGGCIAKAGAEMSTNDVNAVSRRRSLISVLIRKIQLVERRLALAEIHACHEQCDEQ